MTRHSTLVYTLAGAIAIAAIGCQRSAVVEIVDGPMKGQNGFVAKENVDLKHCRSLHPRMRIFP